MDMYFRAAAIGLGCGGLPILRPGACVSAKTWSGKRKPNATWIGLHSSRPPKLRTENK